MPPESVSLPPAHQMKTTQAKSATAMAVSLVLLTLAWTEDSGTGRPGPDLQDFRITLVGLDGNGKDLVPRGVPTSLI